MLYFKITKTDNHLDEMAEQVNGEVSDGVLELPSHLGNGSVKVIQLTEGIKLQDEDFCFNKDLLIDRNIEEDCNSNFFSLIYVFESHDLTEPKTDNSDGFQNHILFFNRYYRFNTFVPAYTKYRQVHFFINLDKILSIAKYYDLPKSLIDLLKSNEAWCYKYPYPLEVQRVLHQMNSYKANSLFSKGYLINKSEELIMLTLEQIYSDQLGEDVKKNFIHQDDIVLINKVEKQLLELSHEEFSINKLADDLSVGIRKLQRLFKAYHGMDMTSYRKHIRMEQAKQMLLEQRYSITDISYKVGYSNISNFSKVFKDYFGMSPSSLLNKTKED